MRKKGLIALSAAILAASVFAPTPAPAGASTITLGAPLTPTSTFFVFNGSGQTLAATAVAEPGLVQSPVDGMIVRWRVRGAAPVSGYAIRVLRRFNELEFGAHGSSAPTMPEGSGPESFAANVPIHAGDYIGLDVPHEGQIGVAVGGGTVRFEPQMAEGETRTGTSQGYEPTFNAEVQPAPSVTLLSPASGSTAGGASVTVAGEDFTEVTAVDFGPSPASSFTIESEHRLTAVAPPSSSAGAVDVTITARGGTSATAPEDRFTYVAPPLASSPPLLGPPSPKCTVPKLRGTTLKAARRRAHKANCALGTVKTRGSATARSGKVVKQNPKAGATRSAGAKIAVTLG